MGVVGGVLLGRYMETLKPADPATLVGAAGVNPITSLRRE